MRASLVLAAVILIAPVAGGCSKAFRGPLTHAASPLLHQGPVKLDLAVMLDPSIAAIAWEEEPEPGRLERAFANFDGGVQRRNSIAGALLLASDRNCDVYLENLRTLQSTWRTSFSLASVGLGAAGAIVTGADTSRLLSGLTGATSGAVGALDNNIMGGMASEVLVAGVRAGREPLRLAIIQNMTLSYEAWPVEIAVADVLRYHGRCNAMSGLASTQRAVEEQLSTAKADPATLGGTGVNK
jgi:hypothetical protein